MDKKIVIELPYLGNLAFYKLLTEFDTILIEKEEFFQKSSFRNRCEIAGPNGRLNLSIPVVGGKDKKQYYKAAKISFEHPWVKDHWNSLCASYRRSPYFEYYEEELYAIYWNKENNLLFDFNWRLFQWVANVLKLNQSFDFTQEYQKDYIDVVDYRSKFLPKKKENISIDYMQVFEEKTGFLSNLSIVDLIFNEGPNAKNCLMS